MKLNQWIIGTSFVLVLVVCILLVYTSYPSQLKADYTAQQEGSDDIVLDNRTGLMWEVKTDTNKTTNYTWEQAITYCETTMDGYAGYSDWRLPTIKELASIVDLDQVNPSIDTGFFPNTQSGAYWSSTTYVVSTSSAWRVSFSDGVDYAGSKTGTSYCRCTR